MERAGSTGSRVWTIGNVLRGQSLQEVWVVVARCDGGFNPEGFRGPQLLGAGGFPPEIVCKEEPRWLSGLCFTDGFGA